jgi:integrase/recombinase XerD
MQFARAQNITALDQVSTDTIKAYLAAQRQRGLSAYTIWGNYKRLKAFFRWCWREQLIPQNIFANLPAPQLPQLLPKVLAVEQIQKLFQQLKRDPSPRGKRDLAIISTFLDTGIRSNELAHLQVQDANLAELYLMITHGKWGKQRPVPISPTLKRLLWRYIAEWRPKLRPRDEALFVNHEGRNFLASGIQVMVRRQLSNIGVRGGTHLFRHTFATLYLRNGGDIERLRLILGHSTLDVTQRYLHLVPDDLVKKHPDTSPLSVLRL